MTGTADRLDFEVAKDTGRLRPHRSRRTRVDDESSRLLFARSSFPACPPSPNVSLTDLQLGKALSTPTPPVCPLRPTARAASLPDSMGAMAGFVAVPIAELSKTQLTARGHVPTPIWSFWHPLRICWPGGPSRIVPISTRSVTTLYFI